MSTPATQERDLPKLQAALAEGAGSSQLRVSGPVTILSASPGTGGGRTYEVSTTVLLPVDEHDPALRDVSIPVPATATVEFDRKGAVRRVAVPPVDAESAHEARAYARNLIQAGAVKGLPPTGRVRRSAGPPVRPTHELKTEADGTKVIRRSGFSIAG
jgi:hypothetical protein